MVRTESKQLTFTQDDVSQNTSKEEVEVLNQFDKAKAQLKESKEADVAYVQLQSEVELEESKKLILTNWAEALPEHKRSTVGDKEAWIKIELAPKKQKLRELRIEKEYKKELFELEKQKYLKESLDTKEEL